MNGKAVKEAMRREGYTYRSLAEAAGIGVATLSMALNHERDIQLSNFKSICNVLGIDPKEVW